MDPSDRPKPFGARSPKSAASATDPRTPRRQGSSRAGVIAASPPSFETLDVEPTVRASLPTLRYDGDAFETATTVEDDSVEAGTFTRSGIPGGVSAQTIRRGDSIGQFLVVDLLGVGAMGVVVSAYDPLLDRKVALKVLKPGVVGAGGAEGKQRLLREAQTMAKLSHPNVITVYEVGTVGDEVFVAMEFVDGGTLRQWMKSRPRSWREIADVFAAAGRGLAAAHDAGFVHRDFKPDNVLVGSGGRVLVTDFGLVGIATELEPLVEGPEIDGDLAASPLSDSLTRTGAVLGTPLYMAPEQHQGRGIAAAADQFAFCVALYEALYGERPFGGDTYQELVRTVLTGSVPDPPRDNRVPGWLRKLVLRGLRLDPAERFPSMRALVYELSRGRRPSRRRKLAIGGAGLVLAAGAAAFIIFGRGPGVCQGGRAEFSAVWNPTRADAVKTAFEATGRPYADATFQRVKALFRSYEHSWVSMHHDACEATHVRAEQSESMLDKRMACLHRRLSQVGALAEVFTHADGKVVDTAIRAATDLDDVKACGDLAALTAAVPPPSDPKMRNEVASVREDLARAGAQDRAGEYKAALARAGAAEAASKALNYTPLQAEALLLLGELQAKTGAYKTAKKTLFSAAQTAARAHDAPGEAKAWSELVGLVGVRLGKPQLGLAWAQPARAALARAGNRAPAIRLVLARNEGGVFLSEGKYDEAESRYRAELDLVTKLHGDNSPLAAQAWDDIGRALKGAGKLADARQAHERALVIVKGVYGTEHPLAAKIMDHLGTDLRAQGDYKGAEKLFRHALAIRKKTLGPNHPDVGDSYNNLASVLAKLGRHQQAIAAYKKAVAIEDHDDGPHSPVVAAALASLAGEYAAVGDDDRARPLYTQVIAILEKTYGQDAPRLAPLYNDLGYVDLAEAHYDDAEADGQRALAIWKKAYGPDHPDIGNTLMMLAQVARARGNTDDAVQLYQRALELWRKTLGPEHPRVGKALLDLGEALSEGRRCPQAIPFFRQALAILKQGVGDSAAPVGETLDNLGDCLLHTGAAKQAAQPLEQAAAVWKARGEGADLAAARFELARALWAGRRHRRRAVKLAQQALSYYAKAGPEHTGDLRQVTHWLAGRRRSRRRRRRRR